MSVMQTAIETVSMIVVLDGLAMSMTVVLVDGIIASGTIVVADGAEVVAVGFYEDAQARAMIEAAEMRRTSIEATGYSIAA